MAHLPGGKFRGASSIRLPDHAVAAASPAAACGTGCSS